MGVVVYGGQGASSNQLERADALLTQHQILTEMHVHELHYLWVHQRLR